MPSPREGTGRQRLKVVAREACDCMRQYTRMRMEACNCIHKKPRHATAAHRARRRRRARARCDRLACNE